MGQATIDLPDPLSESAAAPGANADDLLAQLAGDDIDRLLAEADVERPAKVEPTIHEEPAGGRGQSREVEPIVPVEPAGSLSGQKIANEITSTGNQPVAAATHVVPPADQTTAAELAAKVDSDVSAQLDVLFDQLTQNEGQAQPSRSPEHRQMVTASAPAPSAETDQQVSAQLDDLFAELTKSDSAPTAPQSQLDAATGISQPPVAVSVVAAVESVTVPAPAGTIVPVEPVSQQKIEPLAPPPETQTTQAERTALEVDPTAATPSAADSDVTIQSGEDTVPLMLKPLVWLNQPFAGIPQNLREMLGKVAIVTLVNSLGMILYVLLFRKA